MERNQNTSVTKRSLWMSGLALLLCFIMLIGTTFAWFTDSVKNTGNKIQAGTLDIALLQLNSTLSDAQKAQIENKDLVDKEYTDISDIEAPIFDYNLWEPGYTAYTALKVANLGSLALKYNLKLTANGDAGILGDVIDVYAKISKDAITEKPADFAAITAEGSEYVKVGTLNELIADPDGAAYGVLYAADNMPTDVEDAASAMYCGIALHMREEAGNEYKGQSVGTTFDIILSAAQYTYEKDGFGSADYDKDAPYAVSNTQDLNDAVQNAKPGDKVVIADGTFELPKTIGEGVSLVGNGEKTVMQANQDHISKANVSLSNMTIQGIKAQGNDGSLNINGSNTTLSNVDVIGKDTRSIAITVSTSDSENITTFKNTTIGNAFRGIQFWRLSGECHIEDSFLNGPVYTFNVDAAAPGAKLFLKDTVLKGWTSYTNGIELVSFENCTFETSGRYDYFRPYSTTVLKDCKFDKGFQFNAGGKEAYTITFENCTYDGVPVTAENIDTFKDADDFNPNATVVVK